MMKFERMLAIVMLLLHREKINAKELAEMFEVSIRTIYRDIEAINASGIPIVTTSGVGGGISIMEQYKIDKGIFTTSDITAMLMGLGVISGTLSGTDNTNAIVKLKSFIPEEQINEMNMKINQVIFDLSSWMGSRDSESTLNSIKQALEDNRLLSFTYFGHGGKEKILSIEPHRLVFKGNNWYLQGYSLVKQDFRLFKLRRISGVQVSAEDFLTREAPHPFSDFTDSMCKKMFPVKLLIEESALDKMLDYCTMDDIMQASDGKLIVNFNFIDDDYGYGILMSFGNQLVCIEPDFVRAEIKKRLNDMMKLYS